MSSLPAASASPSSLHIEVKRINSCWITRTVGVGAAVPNSFHDTVDDATSRAFNSVRCSGGGTVAVHEASGVKRFAVDAHGNSQQLDADVPTEKRQPRVGVAVVIVRDGKVLLGQRQGSHGAGYWAFPGGHLEWAESLEQCAAREIAEETGMRLAWARNIGCRNELLPADDKHFVCVFVLAEAVGHPQRMEPDKCADWRWCSLDELPQPLFGSLADALPLIAAQPELAQLAGAVDRCPLCGSPELAFPSSDHVDATYACGTGRFRDDQQPYQVGDGCRARREAHASAQAVLLADLRQLQTEAADQAERAAYQKLIDRRQLRTS